MCNLLLMIIINNCRLNACCAEIDLNDHKPFGLFT